MIVLKEIGEERAAEKQHADGGEDHVKHRLAAEGLTADDRPGEGYDVEHAGVWRGRPSDARRRASLVLVLVLVLETRPPGVEDENENENEDEDEDDLEPHPKIICERLS